MPIFRDNTGWRENLGSNRFLNAVKNKNLLREHEARAKYGNKIIDVIIQNFPIEWHHNENGQIEYFFDKEKISFLVDFAKKHIEKNKIINKKIKELKNKGLKVTRNFKKAKKNKIIKWIKYDTDKKKFFKPENLILADIYIYE